MRLEIYFAFISPIRLTCLKSKKEKKASVRLKADGLHRYLCPPAFTLPPTLPHTNPTQNLSTTMDQSISPEDGAGMPRPVRTA